MAVLLLKSKRSKFFAVFGILLIASILPVAWFVYYPFSFLPIVAVVITAIVIVVRAWRKTDQDSDAEDGDDDIEQLQGNVMPIRYSLNQLRQATGEFSEKLGAGGFGTVYRGTSENGLEIAVKRLERSGQGKKEFLAEVKTIGNFHHRNLARVIGYCSEKPHRALVYEFMPNGSLDKWIFCEDGERSLNWVERKEIVLGMARAMAYIHEECSMKVAHLDIKPQNILLDANLHAVISDFGLSRMIDRDQSHVVTIARGTYGYMAPEVSRRGAISTKADVYSFGVVVLEIVCGRRNLDNTCDTIDVVSFLMEKGREEEEGGLVDLVDQSNEDMQSHKTEAVELLRLAVWCLQNDPAKRPLMSVVVKVLQGDIGVEMNLDCHSQSLATLMAAISVEASILSGPR